jgi:DNA-binding NtrC family response regulator
MLDTVLIIDDASSTVRMTDHIIGQKLGYRTVTVKNGEEATQWILSNRTPQPDLLLLDLTTSDVRELRVLYEAKASRPQLPVIVLTPYGDEQRMAQAAQMGADDCLDKPVTLERLRFSLRNVLAIRRLKQTILRLESKLAAGESYSGNGESPSRLHNSIAALPALFDDRGGIKNLKSVEEEVIRFVLHHCNGCMTRAARHLGIGRSTLYRRVNELEIDGYISRANHAMRPMMTVSSVERS